MASSYRFRSASDEWNILIPYRANSAATLLALGADNIVLGPQGELGPIDPIMSIQRFVAGPGGQSGMIQENISVEDVMAYVRFIQDRGGLSDQDALAAALMKLADRVDAVALGNMYRTHSHIRDVARRILTSRNSAGSEQTLATIVETLAEKVYAHGHAIGLKTAEAIGLPVKAAPNEVDATMWELLEDYEEELKIRRPVDPSAAVANIDTFVEDLAIAVIESRAFIHRFNGRLEITARRQMPPTLNVALNLNLQLQVPGGGSVPAQQADALQQLVAQSQQALSQAAQQAVQEALKQQAPILGIDAGFRNGKWERSD